ncbi:MAG: hypothetical protein QM811_10160 [Pirellulales bacterium]
MLRNITAAIAVGLLVASTGIASADEWGSIKGKFVVTGKVPEPAAVVCNKDPATCCKEKLVDESLVVSKEGGLANVFVYARSKVAKIHPDYDKAAASPVVLDNKACVFHPHAVAVWTKQKLSLKNSDDVGHNTNYGSPTANNFNVLIAPGQAVEKSLTAAENLPQNISCNIHPWMQAKLLVRDNPYFAVSAADGTFGIKNIPSTEEVEFVVWHEKVGYLKTLKFSGGETDAKGRFKMKVGDAKDFGDIKIDAATLSK